MKHVPAVTQPDSIQSDQANRPSRRLCGLVLDCDGVLFDSKEANTAYYNHIRHAVRLPPMTDEEAAYAHMASTEEALERIIPDAMKEEAARVRRMTRYQDTFMPMMRPTPYMLPFLRNMRAAGLRLALCTNRGDSVHAVLGHFDIAQYFAPVITIRRVSPKPSPQGLLEIVKEWDVAPHSIAFLGDSFVDQQAAVAAHVPFWSYDNPRLTAAMHIAGFKELNESMHTMLR